MPTHRMPAAKSSLLFCMEASRRASSICFSLAFLLAFLPCVFARRARASASISFSEGGQGGPQDRKERSRQQEHLAAMTEVKKVREHSSTYCIAAVRESKYIHIHIHKNTYTPITYTVPSLHTFMYRGKMATVLGSHLSKSASLPGPK